MKTSIISPLGLSPPVITAFIEGIAEPITDVVVLTTDNEEVKRGYELVRIGLKIKYPGIKIHEVRLPFDDVYTTEQNLQFMAIAARTIKEERGSSQMRQSSLKHRWRKKEHVYNSISLGATYGC